MSIHNNEDPQPADINKQEEPIYIMTIELEKGKSDHLKVYKDTNPEQLSYEFCHKNNLDYNSLNYLNNQIKELLNDYNNIKEKAKHIDKVNNNTNKDPDVESDTKIDNIILKKEKSKKQLKKTKSYNAKEYLSKTDAKKKLFFNSNPGIFLYERSKKMIENKQRKINEIKKMMILKEEKEATFKPFIYKSVISTPNIQKSSRKNNKKYVSSSSRKEKVTKKVIKKEELKRNKSVINHKNENTSKSLIKKQRELFNIRQQNYLQKIEKKQNIIRTTLYKPFDKTTGQELFKPKLYANNQFSYQKTEYKSNNNVFKDLYKDAERYKVKQSQRNQHFFNKIGKMEKNKTTQKNQEIFKKQKQMAFSKIFKQLDADEDGFISIYNLEYKKIDIDILNIIKPILYDLKEFQGSINEGEFEIECEKLFCVYFFLCLETLFKR